MVAALLVLAGIWLFWPSRHQPAVPARPVAKKAAAPVVSAALTSPTSAAPGQKPDEKRSVASVTRDQFRLTNTSKDIDELSRAPHAVLLENAWVDTDVKTPLTIPKPLQAAGDPGAYIVQARGAADGAFRAAVTAAGAQIVSYIPNNAFLVQMTAAGAGALGGNPLVQAVLPYQPYYKVQSSLLELALKEKPLPADIGLTLGLFPDGADQTVAQLQQLGAEVVGWDRSPFGPVVRVRPPVDWVALAQLPGVQRVEPSRQRLIANDLSRVTMGVSLDSVVQTNYLNLTGNNVLVEVNDTGIDPAHPDLSGRVLLDNAGSGLDTDGHGTFVAGEIAGSGAESATVTDAQGSLMPGTNSQFRGMAPMAQLFSVGGVGRHGGAGLYNFADRMDLGGNDTNGFVSPTNFFLPGAAIYLPFVSDYTFTPGAFPDWYFQEAPAVTNALISNNSWNYGGGADYDLSAASYDAAVRDALPEVTGPQPVLFVFSAGNAGGGNSDGGGGISDTILSPATAKNVITVGALEQNRGITNTYEPFGTTNPSSAWNSESDSASQVADYSSRGNVGIGTEGDFGRFKPDVVAPGSFVVSLRSGDWNTNAYYNPTNYNFDTSNAGQFVDTNFFNPYTMLVPTNTIGIVLRAVPNNLSPTPFPTLAFYVGTDGLIDPSTPGTYDFSKNANTVTIPPDGNLASYIANGSISFAVTAYTNTIPVDYDLIEEIISTNDNGTYNHDLMTLNESLAPNYRYESGTSMAAANVSGLLALMQDFFTNTLHLTPSPALLKALLINGARLGGGYSYSVTNNVNDEGWGLVNLPNSIPAGLANLATGGSPLFFVDQSATNALATGDSRSYNVTIPAGSAGVPLRVTLVWTDPPGNPAAALKLVNNLDLIVSNNVTGDYYVGNSFNATDPTVSQRYLTNSTPLYDTVNNVENVVVPGGVGTNFTVTVLGRDVNVNAVTTEQTNIVQDFALVVSSVDLGVTNAITVTPVATVSALAPQITGIGGTNGILFNQLSGASAPWLSTNFTLIAPGQGFGTSAGFYPGQTNQWHFYVVTNTTSFTNAAFITFIPNTLALPREGVFAGSEANSTRPEADLDLFAAAPTDPLASGLTNLSPVVISNCLYSVNGDQASLARGGTKFLVYSNSAGGDVYYVGVKCEDQTAGQYGFLAVFTDNGFSTTDTNGNVYVNGLNVPLNIPDGNNQHPGVAYIVSLALPTDPTMTLRNVIVSNTITHQNFGDLVGQLTHNGAYATLNNHDDVGSVINDTFVYNDGVTNETPGSQTSAGPGTLQDFRTLPGLGLWLLNEIDDNLTQTGTVENFQMKLVPHVAKDKGLTEVTVPANGWFYDFIEVPVGVTNLTLVATNITIPPALTPPVQLFLNDNGDPTLTDFLVEADLNLGSPPGNSISYGPPIMPGIYYVGLYNPSSVDQTVLLGVTLAFNPAAIARSDWASTGAVPLKDDAVTYAYQFVTNLDVIQGINVGLRVDHPRISDLAFTLISPDGTRYLLMENRGGQSTNGAGASFGLTNTFAFASAGSAGPVTNTIQTGLTSGTGSVSYDFGAGTNELAVDYAGSQIFSTGPVTGSGTNSFSYGPGGSTTLAAVINPSGATNYSTNWHFTVTVPAVDYSYLSFTEDTNLTTTPIKFAVPPFALTNQAFGASSGGSSFSDFESAAAGDYAAASAVDGWSVVSNQVSVVSDAANAQGGSNFLALANGAISNSIVTTPGASQTITFSCRGPGIAGWWRAENNTVDSINGNNGILFNGAGYAAGEVGSAFNFNGVNQFMLVQPSNSSLDVGQGSGLTMEGWIYPKASSPDMVIAEYERTLGSGSGSDVGVQFLLNVNPQTGVVPGALAFNIVDTSGNYHPAATAPNTVPINVWQHVAMTYNRASGIARMFLNGSEILQTNLGSFVPQTGFTNIIIGGRTTFGSTSSPNSVFNGNIDELSFYNRALSGSELKAIYQNGSAGKFDPAVFGVSPSESLAEASVSIPGITNFVVLGSNTNWQSQSVTFTATNTSTPIVISGLEPGLLLDSFSVGSSASTALQNLYYQPEQSLDPLLGTKAFGLWTLEVLDNRAGATNNASLVGWDLNFTFANTNFTLGTITNAFPGASTNYIPGGGLQWFEVDVPTNADLATNTLIFATLPLNLWWSTNVPPTITNSPPDTELLAGVTNGTAVLGTNGSPVNVTPPAHIEPGRTYYLGVQNPNAGGATYAVDVTFHLLLNLPTVVTEAATNIVSGAATLQGTVTPNGGDTTVYFDYGTDTNYLSGPTGSILLTNNYTVAQPVQMGVSNLVAGQVYHYRVVGTNSFGIAYGADMTFTNPYAVPPPYAFTLPATRVDGSSAQFNGFATPNGYPAQAWFQWGRSTSYTSNTPPVNVGTNFNVVFVTNYLANTFLTNQAFHFRLVVSNEVGVTYGFDQVLAQGSVVTWGSDFAGQTVPVPPGLTNLVTGVGAGYDFSLALNYDGTVIAWGDDASGQTNVPAGLNNAVAVAGGFAHSLALRSDETVLAWGDDTYNQTNVPANLTNAVVAASGAYFNLALGNDGQPVAWGRNSNGQTNIPAGLSNVVDVAAGYAHGLALKNDGTVVAWGNNAFGQTNVPAGLTNVVAIAAGHDDSLALRGDGTVVAWGSNANNQTNVPTSLTNVTAITAGYYHCQALKGDGSVYFWGDSSSGQLNGFTNVNNPGALTNVFAISGGGFHTLSVQAPYGLNVTNSAPYWTNGLAGSTVTMNEMTVTNINNAALDSNAPPQLIFYSLPTNNPAFATIDSFSGVITLSPQEGDGPSTNTIVTVATDNGYPPMSSTNAFTLIVNEVNTPPFWTNGIPASTNYTIGVGQLLVVTNTATDSDIPTNPLSYTDSISPAASGLAISTNGVITWTPALAGNYTITTVVTDYNPWAVTNQHLSATNFIFVTVTNTAPVPGLTNITISGIAFTTNSAGSNGFLLTWFAPSNALFNVQWSDALAPANWQTFTNPLVTGYNTNFPASATNARFNFFDDGSQSGGFGPTRFYRLILLQATNTISFQNPSNQVVNLGGYFTITNTAVDSRAGAILTYTLMAAPPGATITNDVITWSNAAPAGLAARFTTLVTDDSLPPVSATNTFTVFVAPFPAITNVTVTATNTLLSWLAPTNDQFQVRWTTNLVPPVTWTKLPSDLAPATITSLTGAFSYTDTNAPVVMKFYQLILLP